MPGDDPLFSVIVPTYERPEFVARAVRSILDQTVGSCECLVVYDGAQTALELPADDRVRVVSQQVNGGSAAARNTGIEAARGRFVAFLDDDDQYTPDRLELALAGLERADIAICWSRFEGAEAVSKRVLEGDVRETILEHLVPNVGQISIRRDKVVRFDERMRCCEDIEWWIRAAQELLVTTVPTVGLVITSHANPRHLKSAAERAEARVEILERYDEFFASRPRAAAFQWKRVGRCLLAAGDRVGARRAFRRSLSLRPSARTAVHLLRSIGPATRSATAVPVRNSP